MDFTAEELAAMRQGMSGDGGAAPDDNTPDPIDDGASQGDSSLKNNVPAPTADPVSAPVPIAVDLKPIDTPPVKSFEEILAERTKGKYKRWEEVESEINTPKEAFFDDEVRHWNNLKGKGVKLDKTFFELQSLNLDSLKDPKNILLQSMKLKEENNNVSDRTLLFLIEKKYGLSNWIEKEESELTDEDVANRELLGRDAQMEYKWLQDYKKERTFLPETDPAKAKQEADAKLEWQAEWEQFVDGELSNKVSNLSVIVNPETKEVFDYKVSESDRKEVTELMKTLPKNVYALFNRFTETDSKGNAQIDHAKVAQMILRDKLFDQAVLKARSDGEAEGARKEIEKLKNVNFKPGDNGTAGELEPQTAKDALTKALKSQGKIF